MQELAKFDFMTKIAAPITPTHSSPRLAELFELLDPSNNCPDSVSFITDEELVSSEKSDASLASSEVLLAISSNACYDKN